LRIEGRAAPRANRLDRLRAAEKVTRAQGGHQAPILDGGRKAAWRLKCHHGVPLGHAAINGGQSGVEAAWPADAAQNL
jgi:hypothetical protein